MARDSEIISFLDRDWWDWNGWTAVAALGTVAAALVALRTLWFFWLQLIQVRGQARDQAERQQATLEMIHGQLNVGRQQAKEVRAIATVAVLFSGVVFGMVLSAGAGIYVDALRARRRTKGKRRSKRLD